MNDLLFIRSLKTISMGDEQIVNCTICGRKGNLVVIPLSEITFKFKRQEVLSPFEAHFNG